MSDRHAMPTQSRRLRRRRAFFLVVGFLWATPVLSDAALAENPLVTIDISPPSLTVMVGMSVTWLNKDDIPHTVVSKTRQFKSKALHTDDSFSFTFNEAGTYEYFCSLHPHMTGTIVVVLASRAAR